ncbi:MAG: GerW family sporulation protein [bacterium]|jgi:sporulation protein YtfJ
MEEHPIQGLMKTAMESIKEMVDVNTIVGDPVETQEGGVIIPISRIALGFAAGGSEFEGGKENGNRNGDGAASAEFPFGGGSGAGVSVQPVAFLVVQKDQIRLLPVNGQAIYDRLIDIAPDVINKVQNMFKTEKTKETVTVQ